MTDRTESIRWWEWPGVWGLDAALVAVVWQQAFARFYGVEISWPCRVALALTVVAVYLADRLLDGAGARPRHRLPARFPVIHVALALLCAAGAVWLAVTKLAPSIVLGGVALMAATMALLGGGNQDQRKILWWRMLTLLLWSVVFGLFALAVNLPPAWCVGILLVLVWRGSAALGARNPGAPMNFTKGIVFSMGCMLAPVLSGSWHTEFPFQVYALPLVAFGALAAHSMEVLDEAESGRSPERWPPLLLVAVACAVALRFAFSTVWGQRFSGEIALCAAVVFFIGKLAPPSSRPFFTDMALLLPALC